MDKENRINEKSEAKEGLKIVRRVGFGDDGSGMDKVPMGSVNAALKMLLDKLLNNNKRRS